MCNRTRRVQALRTSASAVENRVATVERERVLQTLTTLSTMRVTRVSHPAVSLHEDGRAKVRVTIPPVRWACRCTASTENALVQTIEMAALFWALQILATARWRASRLQVWLNTAVLLVELCEIRNQVLDNVSVWERVNVALTRIAIDAAQASERVHTINVHRTASANTLTARATESQGRVLFVLDLQKRIKNHRSGLVQVDVVGFHVRLLRWVFWVLGVG